MRPNYELCHVVVRITQRVNHFRKGDVLVIDPKRVPELEEILSASETGFSVGMARAGCPGSGEP
jgi:hypothetical protein